MALSYESAIERLGSISPSLEYPTQFIEWAETVVDILCVIYSADYEQATQDIYESAKEYQNYESDDED